MMQIQNGLYAARKTENGVHSVFIDEDMLAAQELNAMTQANKRRAERDEAERKGRERLARMAAEQERQRLIRARERQKRKARALLKKELGLLGMAVILVAGQMLGLADIRFVAPLVVVLQAVICYKAGKWMGKQKG